ncbi:DUF5994 family protein [Virgisporangium ochraceum]|uniref:Uncharacterized protein n=1 Tax=Virgisporangium ochraceum TaxID=65505 RepID=A0A8J4EHW0_9ACTN|nr:DUF5994 family protein [Virgisporangium ochraceum]GIJ75148.1 hypothetical protein Voc01_100650 [Virgisporangium ochraceum]
MSTAAQHTTDVASTPSSPRLVLATVRARQAVLDGGWWPRSRDPFAEFPGLVEALSARYGPVRQLMLNSSTWDSRFKRLTVGDRVVRAGWFASVDPMLLIATTDRGEQVDLLVVPPSTPAGIAEKAMARAADPDNRRRAQAILVDPPEAPARTRDAREQPAWDNEGGRVIALDRRRP